MCYGNFLIGLCAQNISYHNSEQATKIDKNL